jgi:signal transduction histidine kinase
MDPISDSDRTQLAALAHDYNNLLGVVVGFAAFARKKVQAAAGDPAKFDQLELAARDLERVERAGGEAIQLTRRLVALINPQPPSEST